MIEDVTKRLLSYGYTVTADDSWVLNFIILKTENHIKNQCNTSVVPEGLHEVAVDMVVGEFMQGKKSIGQLTGINLGAIVKSIQEGDSKVDFAGELSPEQRLESLIAYLLHGNINFATYRRIKW
jgi:hypothetical protein